MATRSSPSAHVVKLAAIHLPGSVELWTALGFSADGGRIALTNGAIEVGHDALALAVEAPDSDSLAADVEGVRLMGDRAVDTAAVEHPNGAFELDHVVVMTPDLDRTSLAIETATGLVQRRLRETPEVRQAFHRFDRTAAGAPGCIIEVVERPGLTATSIWGLVVNVADLDAFALSNDRVGDPRDAVQPGRRIATVRRSADIGVAVAFMSPDR